MNVLKAIFTFSNIVAALVIDILLVGVAAVVLVGAVAIGGATIEVRAPLVAVTGD